MRFSFCLRNWTSARFPRGREQHRPASPRFRPRLEALEDRTLPSTFYAATTSDLIADINAANKVGGANSITLTAPTTSPYVLTAVDNTTNGANGLPVISGGGKKTAADNLTILGNGDSIERSTASGTPTFRLFDVAGGGSLTLENVTLTGGLAFGSGAAADGGAVYNQGTLTLSNTIVQGNTAQGSNGLSSEISHRNKLIPPQAGAGAEGGGIWTNGTVTLEAGTLIGSTNGSYPLFGQGNKALGGRGGTGYGFGTQGVNGGAGGGGFGGGLYQAGGSVTVSNATLAGNVGAGGGGGLDYAQRSFGGNGGAAGGGGLYMASGTLVMSNNTVEDNTALGGNGGAFSGLSASGGTGGTGSGGGVYVGGGAVSLQTVQLLSNRAQGGDGGEYHFTEGVTTGLYDSDRGFGGSGLGGGLYLGGGAVTLTGDTVTGNGAYAGGSGYFGVPNGSSGVAAGAGIDIAPQATVSLDPFTLTNTTQNDDYVESSLGWILVGEDDIHGSYTLT